MASDSGSGFPGTDDYESLISTTDVEHLKSVWRREKAAPEIFQFETALIERIREQIQLMTKINLNQSKHKHKASEIGEVEPGGQPSLRPFCNMQLQSVSYTNGFGSGLLDLFPSLTDVDLVHACIGGPGKS
ncbi:hypothetical protein PanWU01x14_121090 [Parasponia andersonii]|uniref:Uncharacterized protein n=1 Tax=Parasponia andersonii TaxID=3476 RepID=A0A2P5CV67_PARAD|nr:hypothetical protein PanWU01x14_121090 [Parasponia andersonii]